MILFNSHSKKKLLKYSIIYDHMLYIMLIKKFNRFIAVKLN